MTVVRLSPAQSAPRLGELTGATVPLTPGRPVPLEISAGERRALSFTVCSGCYAEIDIEQTAWMISAYVSGPGIADDLPYASDAGLHSIVRIPVIAPRDAQYTVEIAAAKPNAAATTVTLTTPRPATSADRQVEDSAHALLKAEWARRTGTTNQAAHAVAMYDASAAGAQSAGDARLQLQAELGKARSLLYRTGDYPAGLAAATAAISTIGSWNSSPSPADVALEAMAWKVLASADYFLARYPDMIVATESSLTLYRTLGDIYWQGIQEGNIASVYAQTGDSRRAEAAAEDALRIARELSDAQGVAFSEETLAEIHHERGEYQAAFDADHVAMEAIQRTPYVDEEGQVWTTLAELFDELNDTDEERDALQKALPLIRRSSDTSAEITALCDLGLLDIHAGNLKAAAASFDSAMRLASPQHLQREEAETWLGRAQLLAAGRRLPEAMAAVQSGLDEAVAVHEVTTTAQLLQVQGDLQARLNNDPAAMQSYHRAETAWSQLSNLQQAALARASMARIEFRSGDLEAAHQDVLLALDGFEAARRKIAGHSLRESYFASVHDFYDLAIAIDLRRARRDPSAVEEAWQITERSRARSLADAVRSSGGVAEQRLPATLLDARAATGRQIAAVQQTISRLYGTTADTGALHRAAMQLHALVLQDEDNEAHERQLSEPLALIASPRPPSLEGMRTRLLDRNDALLEYWAGSRGVTLWVITRNSLRTVRLGDFSALTAAVQAYRATLLAREEFPANESFSTRRLRIARADEELDGRALALGRLLLPVRLPSSVHRLIVVPDGAIASIPFAALRTNPSTYFIQKYELSEEPSVEVAMELRSRPAATPEQDHIAIFADAVYNEFDPRLLKARQGNFTGQSALVSAHPPEILRSDFDVGLSELPRLTASSREAAVIASIAGEGQVRSFLGFRATPDAVMKTPWKEFAIAHFAAHAIVNDQHPELSGIVLSTFNSRGQRQDGVLWLHDIYQSYSPVPLVVLSGCRTAAGRAVPNEGISGLAQAFLSSGASGVIGSLWSVEDRSAAELIPDFYRGLLGRHLSVAAALRSAQLHMIGRHQPSFHWAAYIVEGDGGQMLPLEPQTVATR
jgi:CHAT domain-containing protein/tetratricopeptide (TPR) repeat protein